MSSFTVWLGFFQAFKANINGMDSGIRVIVQLGPSPCSCDKTSRWCKTWNKLISTVGQHQLRGPLIRSKWPKAQSKKFARFSVAHLNAINVGPKSNHGCAAGRAGAGGRPAVYSNTMSESTDALTTEYRQQWKQGLKNMICFHGVS